MKLRYAPRARSDIAHIYEYIARHDTRAATTIVQQIRPGLGRETDIPGVRVLPTVRYPYLVYHRVRESELIIIHVRDGRRDALKTGDL